MSTPNMVPMLAPDGTAGYIPSDRVNDALKMGGKLGVEMAAPDGTKGIIPRENIVAGIQAGGKVLHDSAQYTTQFEKDRNPDNQKGFFSSAASEVGNMVAGLPAAAKAMSDPIGTGLRQAADLAVNDSLRAKNDRSAGYRVAAALGTPLGVNATGMERQADVGNAAGVAGIAAGDAAPYAAPLAAGAVAGKLRPVVAAGADKLAPALYRSALKPPVSAPLERTAGLVTAGLENKVPVSAAGIEKIGSLIDDLNQKITDEIASQPGKTVNKFGVASRLSDTADTLSKQVNPEKDLQAVSTTGNEFLRNLPTNIPASDAQALKVGTYQQIKAKYGQMGNAQVEAEKALARGLKEELATQFPELDGLNAKESKLLDLQPALERAVSRNGNHQLIGIGTPIAGGAAGLMTGSPATGAVAATLKAIFDNPEVKSKIAIALHTAGNGMPMSAANAKVAAYSAALAKAAGQSGQPASEQTAKR